MTSRALTAAEVSLCLSVFGQAIDYGQVNIFNRKWWLFQNRRVTMAPDGNLWFHPQSDLFCDDFCGSPRNVQALFIHEMARISAAGASSFLSLRL